jgi:hypothetical protein
MKHLTPMLADWIAGYASLISVTDAGAVELARQVATCVGDTTTI